MRLYTILAIVLLTALSPDTRAADPEIVDSTVSLLNSGDFDAAYAIIAELETVEPADPEYFVLAINYYFLKSQTEVVRIDQDSSTSEEMQLELVDSSGQTAGYMWSETATNRDTLNVGLEIMRKGLGLFPERLDMHFGLVYVLQSVERWDEMTAALLRILILSRENQQRWLWSYSKPFADDAEEYVRENVQARVHLLFSEDTTHTDSLLMVISEEMIRTFPRSTYGPSNLGQISFMQDDFDGALKYYLTAYSLDSTDAYVLVNLGDLCDLLGRSTDAVHYYEQLRKFGDADFRALAEERLEAINAGE